MIRLTFIGDIACDKPLLKAAKARGKGRYDFSDVFHTEDVFAGSDLVMLESLGSALGVETPICTALINIASAALGRSMRAEGRTPASLGIENMKAILRDSGKREINI